MAEKQKSILRLVMLAIIILPLPVVLIDILILVNLVIVISIYQMSFSHEDMLGLILEFPSLLSGMSGIIMAIDIALTRLILMDGHAGEIIETVSNVFMNHNKLVMDFIFMAIVVYAFKIITGIDKYVKNAIDDIQDQFQKLYSQGDFTAIKVQRMRDDEESIKEYFNCIWSASTSPKQLPCFS